MSNKVSALVVTRIAGSAHRKSILAYLADKASDDGEGIYCSKGTIADETEIARSTVFKIVAEFIEEGILIEAGERPCANGHTIVYHMSLAAIEALAKNETCLRNEARGDARKGSAQRTPPVRQPDPTSPLNGPHQSVSRTQTILEPSLNKEEEEAREREADYENGKGDLLGDLIRVLGFARGQMIPKYWMASDAPLIVSRWQTDLGLTSAEIIQVAKSNAIAHGSPANGPKTLTRHMQDYAAAKNAPALTPSQHVARPTTANSMPTASEILARMRAREAQQ